MSTADIRIERAHLPQPQRGENQITLVLRNLTAERVTCIVTVQVAHGFWFRGTTQVTEHIIEPLAVATLTPTYRCASSAGSRVTVNVAAVVERLDAVQAGDTDPIGPTGVGFVHLEQGCIRAFVEKGGYAEAHARQIVDERAQAVNRICRFLDVASLKTTLVLYNDPTTKLFDTGHLGMGLTRGATVVEVLNERERVDPFHELVHVLSEQIGHPPAAIREGLAVYLAETLGARALTSHPDILSAAKSLSAQFWPLQELVALTEIGPPESRPEVAYAQAGSLVKYLVEVHGWPRFRAAYRAMGRSEPATRNLEGPKAFNEIYGVDCGALEREWLEWLRTA